MTTTRPTGRLVKGICWMAAMLLLGVVAGVVALFFPQQLLTVDSGPEKADIIVLIGGGGRSERAQQALALYRAGAAPHILCTGLGDGDSNRALLERGGVPPAAILQENESHNTSENAQFSVPILHQLGVKSAILVTSWYHSRRARQCFQHYAPDLVFYSRPDYSGFPTSPWQPQAIRGHARSEYLKLLGYLVRYGVNPF